MTKLTRRHATALILVAPAAVATPALAAAHAVRIRGSKFQPATLAIKAGDSVTWTNNDGMEHTATAKDKSWTTASLTGGQSGSVTFSTRGEYNYICRWHPGMKGKIVVS